MAITRLFEELVPIGLGSHPNVLITAQVSYVVQRDTQD